MNQSRLLVCDLGNPMKAGASVSPAREGGSGRAGAHLSRAQGRRGGGWNQGEASAQADGAHGPLLAPQIWGGLRFTVPHLRDTKKTIQFDFQILR